VCILYGGISSEREVSLNTGKSIYDAISDDYDIVMHDWDGDYELMYDVVKKMDLVFIALHGGDGENGTIQKYLESKNIRFTGSSSSASKKAMDKNISKLLCVEYDIPTPNWVMLDNKSNVDGSSSIIDTYLDGFDFKNGVVVKPNSEGSSIGISILKNVTNEKLECVVKKVNSISSSAMLETFIDGRELTVSVLDGKTLPIVEIVPRGDYYDYKSKYTKFQSNYIVPANINKKTQELLSEYSLKIHKLIGCGVYSRVDFRLSNDGLVYFLEINTLPGFTDTSLFPKAAEKYALDYRALIKKIIDLS
tara:strand:- start:559 stop:1476 length:918 start_codon:yes stop_codon:yes gene_type:complete